MELWSAFGLAPPCAQMCAFVIFQIVPVVRGSKFGGLQIYVLFAGAILLALWVPLWFILLWTEN